MDAVFHQFSSDPHRASFRRRVVAFVLALLVHVALGLMLLRMASVPSRTPDTKRPPLIVQLLPEPQRAAARSKDETKSKPASGKVTPRPPELAPEPPVPPLELIPLTRAEFAAADISRMRSYRPNMQPSGTGATGAGSGNDSGAAHGTGDGPNGEQLFNADWYREPTSAELAFYLPANGPRTGWGMVACQTVKDFHVDNCREIGQSPPGSGLASAVRQAAWQFRVLPPRIGGRPLIGAWVRIRIEYSERGAAPG